MPEVRELGARGVGVSAASEGIFRGLLIREAIASTAMEHPGGCGCDICRAAAGDGDAFGRVLVQVNDELARREG